MQDLSLAIAYVTALTGSHESVIDLRAIHDVRKDIAAIPFRGVLSEIWQSVLHYQSQGYGIFCTVNQFGDKLNDAGRINYELDNVTSLRAHVVDLDNEFAPQNYQRGTQFKPAPSFAVNTSPNKYHLYWPVLPYAGNDYYRLLQRKLRQLFDGDRSVIDPTRVLRLPGSLHLKNPNQPHLVKCHSLAGYGQALNVTSLEAALSIVNIVDGGSVRKELGDESLQAPTLDWLKHGLSLADPNNMDRSEWVGIMAAFKQAGWNHADEDTLRDMFFAWCAKYEDNNEAENLKNWNSIRNTELGWKSMCNRIPSLKAQTLFNGASETKPSNTIAQPDQSQPPALDCKGEMLTHVECQEWFKGCVYVASEKKILTPNTTFMDSGQFNAMYGGKQFIISGADAKKTDEAWKAATRSTMWTIPKFDHMRFVPQHDYQATIEDDLGRKGVNTYKPIILKRAQGDVTPYTRHVELLIPNELDRQNFHHYLAHNVQRPGFKIPWAFVIQSTPGVGKGVFKKVMMHCMGVSYCHFPNAKELGESGAKFNAWMRRKLFILADEIKVDDRRDMIEVLKPMISEIIIEVQQKGVDQVLEDNYSNWLFFTNYKDAVPTDQNDRRFAIIYTAMQTVMDLINAGMNKEYFQNLFKWLDNGGVEIVADYYMNYPIDPNGIDMRAPDTSSTAESIRISRTPIENIIHGAIEDNLQGFRGGWVSSISVQNAIKAAGRKPVQPQTIKTILENMGYHEIGKAYNGFMQESPVNPTLRPMLYALQNGVDVGGFGPVQGWG